MKEFKFKQPSNEMDSTLKDLYINALKDRFKSIVEQDNKLTKQQAEYIMCCNRTLIPQGFSEYEINIDSIEILKEKKILH